MRYVFIFCFAFCWQVCLGQNSRVNFKYADKTVNTIAFEKQSDKLDTHEIRRIPEDVGNKFPFYISFGSLDRSFVHYEFFRIDTTRYFVREYFKERFPPRESVKSFGEEMVGEKNPGAVYTDIFDIECADKIPYYLASEQLLQKEGEWTEFENGTQCPTFWRGDYKNDKKTGIWKRMLAFDADTVLIGKIDYSEKSDKSIYGGNGIREVLLPNLQELLEGEWLGSSYVYNGNVIRCHKDIGQHDYGNLYCYLYAFRYQFDKSGKFNEKLPIFTTSTNRALKHGTWKLRRNGDHTFIDMVHSNGKKWELELLYYSEKEGLFMNLNKHPQPSK